MLALLFASVLALAFSASDSTSFSPRDPFVDTDVRHPEGLATRLDIRCGWMGPPGARISMVEVLGPVSANVTRTIGRVNVTGTHVKVHNVSGITIVGTLDCKNDPVSGCEDYETSFARLIWPNYVWTWDDPVQERMGCKVLGKYQGATFMTSDLIWQRMRDDEPRATTPQRNNMYIPEKPKADLEVRYLTQGLANYVSVRCSWTGPDDAAVTRLQVLGPTPDRRVLPTTLGLADGNGARIEVSNITGMTIEGSVNCGAAGSGCKEGEKAYAKLIWPSYRGDWEGPVFEHYGCQVWGTHPQRRVFTSRTLIPLRVREDQKNDIIDPRLNHESMHFRLRGGLNSEGTVNYLFMRCSAWLDEGLEVKAIEIVKPAGSILSGVYVQGNHTNPEGSNTRIRYQLDCAADDEGCQGNEKAYLGVIWRRMDFDRDIGVTEVNGDHYALTCKIRAVSDGDSVTYIQTRAVRVRGGLGSLGSGEK